MVFCGSFAPQIQFGLQSAIAISGGAISGGAVYGAAGAIYGAADAIISP